tara:strand:+ start:70 stop:609 length:540 start_codon:yes stop_codon:yes gene_type:complete
MPLVPLLPLFHRLNQEHFDGTLSDELDPSISLRWSDGRLKSKAGFYRRFHSRIQKKNPEIVLSRPILEKLPITAVESTLCHEMIHAWIDLVLHVNEVHGPNFLARMNQINSSQNRFQVSIFHSYPVPLQKPKWIANCKECGRKTSYRRLVKGAACRFCCGIHNGGLWNAKYLLTYSPAS